MKKADLTNDILNRQRIGSILKAYREGGDMSQRDVAYQLGYSNVNFISMIETGRSNPPLAILGRMKGVYDLDDLFAVIILKYNYPDAWTACSAALNGEKFNCNIAKINQDAEKHFRKLIAKYCEM